MQRGLRRSSRLVMRATFSALFVLAACRAPRAFEPRFLTPELLASVEQQEAKRRAKPRSREPILRIATPPVADPRVGRQSLSMSLDRTPLAELLATIAEELGLDLVLDAGAADGLEVTLRADALPLAGLIAQLESTFPIRIALDDRSMVVKAGSGPRLSLLIYPLPSGLVERERPVDFTSLRQLSFISRSQRSDATSRDAPPSEPTSGAEVTARDDGPTAIVHLEAFMERVGELLPWPEGSSWHLDRRRNLLMARSSADALRQLERCLDVLCREPLQIEIEAQFVELSELAARDLGVELAILEDYALRRRGRDPQLVIGGDSHVEPGIPAVKSEGDGLRLSVLGVLTEPSFRALVHALEQSGEGEVISAPAVTTLNNCRATIAITTNLPYVEDYRPVFNRRLVAADGLAESDAEVALVAEINDENFTGIVLNVTPSIGTGEAAASAGDRIQLRLRPVVRDEVGSIEISSGALVAGVDAPAIRRPIIETRFIDTQMAIPDGATILLGGLENTKVHEQATGVPWLRSVPLVGALFGRDVVSRERRDLVIFVTARIVR